MKKLIYSRMSGSYDDDDLYYLVRDEETGEFFILHRYHYWRPSGVDQGETRISLEQFEKMDPELFEKAQAEIASIDGAS
jgi:hypothetical protein